MIGRTIICVHVCLLLFFKSVTAAEFADSVRNCSVDSNAELNKCLGQVLEELRPRLATGIPAINVPVLEPMHITNIVFVQEDGPINIRATFRNVEVRGLTKFITNYVRADPDNFVLDIGMRIPEMRITGFYELDGSLFILPINGQGTFWTILTGVDAEGLSHLGVENRGISEHLQVLDTNINFEIGKIRLRLNNLFNGDNLLGETMNAFLNDNGQEVLEEVKPKVAYEINNLVQKVMNDAFSAIPVNKFLSGRRSHGRSQG